MIYGNLGCVISFGVSATANHSTPKPDS